VWQDISGKAKEKVTAPGVAIVYLRDDRIEKEVYSDMYGKHGVVS
jgi:ketol-acid reductoisomerase